MAYVLQILFSIFFSSSFVSQKEGRRCNAGSKVYARSMWNNVSRLFRHALFITRNLVQLSYNVYVCTVPEPNKGTKERREIERENRREAEGWGMGNVDKLIASGS